MSQLTINSSFTTATSSKAKGRYFSSPFLMLGLIFIVIIYSLLVYVVPTLSNQSYIGSFDAYTYAMIVADDSENAKNLQPFLGAYPAKLSIALLPLFAVVLHTALLVFPLLALSAKLDRRQMLIIFSALAVPESALFLGAVSKEGMAITAVIAVLAGQVYFFSSRPKIGFLLTAYAIAIAEYSRPGFGYPFIVAVLGSYFPCLKQRTRRLIVFLVIVIAAICAWLILVGPLKDQATETYTEAKIFLEWFEDNLGSNSPIKTAIRSFFALIFSNDEPSLLFLGMAIIMAALKAVVYLLSIPLISPPSGASTMPVFTWQITYQVATTISTLSMVYGLNKLRKTSTPLLTLDRCRLWFGFLLLFLISISTAIFHVRYRAPAVVAILIAIWLARKKRGEAFFTMTFVGISAACFGIVATF